LKSVFARLTLLGRRVINACFVQGGQDRVLLLLSAYGTEPGAKSDAAKLNTPSSLAVEACSEFRKELT
jgi:hypothetical protein